MNMFEFSLSRAIIRSKYTVILTLGAVIGVLCLIVITSLFNNYYKTSENVFMGIHPHIKVQNEGLTLKQAQTTAQELMDKFPAIAAVKPALYKEVTAEIAKVFKKKFFCVRDEETRQITCFNPHNYDESMDIKTTYGFTIVEKKKQTILLKGIIIENNEAVSGIKKIINGSTRLDDLNKNFDENGNLLPWNFYMQQDLFFGAEGLKDFLIRFPGRSNQQFHLLQKGTLGLGTKKGKYPLLVMSLKNAQQCLKITDNVNILEIKLKDPYVAETLSAELNRFLGPDYKVESWIQHSKGSFAFLKIIKIMILAIIFSIALVAAIGMVSTLTLIVMQNRSKIAILKSMGIKNSGIYKIFIFNTGLTGLIGVASGTILGLLSSRFVIHYFGDSLKKLGIKNPQILIEPREISFIALAIVTLFLLTAVIPSRRAINTDVVEGLQEQ